MSLSLSEPVASATLVSLKHFRTFVKPYLQSAVEGITAITGQKPLLHICGKTRDRWMDLHETGIGSFSVDNCEDLTELKKVGFALA